MYCKIVLSHHLSVEVLQFYFAYENPCHIGTEDGSREITTSGLRDGSSDDMHRLEYFYHVVISFQ